MLIAFLVAVGCGGEQREMGTVKKVFPLDQVPENVRKIAEKEFKGKKMMDAFKKHKKDGTFISYEIRSKDPETGKINEVGIAPNGEILDRE